jgi:hypothetical protein
MTVTPLAGLPELFHIGWVVRDCAAAQRELTARLGAGPFVSAGQESRFDQALVHGKPTPFSRALPARRRNSSSTARGRETRCGGCTSKGARPGAR